MEFINFAKENAYENYRNVLKEYDCIMLKFILNFFFSAEVLDRYAFSVFCDYLPTCLVASMRSHLGIVEAPKADILQRFRRQFMYKNNIWFLIGS